MMARGSIRINADLMDKSTPEFSAVLDGFFGQGIVRSKVWGKPGVYTITLDHPDFTEEEDAKYDLVVTQQRDGWGNSWYKLSCLKVLDSAGLWRVVRDYLGEAKGSVHVQ